VTLDVFLESGHAFDREAAEAALARNGVPPENATVTTADGGEASVTVDDDGCVFVVESLTPELAQVLFDVARSARLAILPADGTPTALVVGDAAAPDELEARHVDTAEQLYEALRQSVTRREEARGARTA
jgi:hypothetical protein